MKKIKRDPDDPVVRVGRTVRLGDSVVRTVMTGKSACFTSHPIRGNVVYIHPSGRYHTVEFQGISGKFRESYPGILAS